jgi:hypothetical protein
MARNSVTRSRWGINSIPAKLEIQNPPDRTQQTSPLPDRKQSHRMHIGKP